MIQDLVSPLRVRNLIQGKREDSFLSYIDLWAIEENAGLGVSGSATIGFELTGRNILLRNEGEIESFYQGIAHLLDSLPYRGRTDLQVSFEVEPGSPKVIEAHRKAFHSPEPLAQKMLEERIQGLEERGIRHTRIYLFITLREKDAHGPSSWFDVGGERTPRGFLRIKHEEKLEELREVGEAVSLSLETIGIPKRRLTGRELALYFYRALNPVRSHLIPTPSAVLKGGEGDGRFSLSGPRTARSRLLFSRARSEAEYVTIDGVHHAVVNLHEKPESVDEWSMKRFIDLLPFDYKLLLTVRTVDEEKVKGEKKIDSNFNRNLYEYSPFKNYEARQKFQELDQFLEEASGTTQRPYHFSLSVLLKDRDPEILKDKMKETLLAFRELGEAEAVSEDFDHFPLFFSHLPGHTRRNFRGEHLLLTDALAYLFPLYEEWRGSPEAPTILTTRRRELVKFDFWDPRNPANHGIVAGSTGGGKSFAVNYLIKDFLLQNPARHQAIVVDVGFSYRKLARAFRGEYYEIDLSGKYALNPFPEKSYLERGKETDLELLTYLDQLLGKMVVDSAEENLSGSDLVLIEQVILEVYRRVAPHEAPRLSDVMKVLLEAGRGEALALDEEDRKKAIRYGKNLRLYAEGLYGRVLNQPGKLSIESPLLVYNLLKLSDHPKLQSVISFIIRSLIHAKLVDLSLKKLIVFDETHMLFNDPVSVELIRSLYRIIRKYNACVYSISQSPNDYLQSRASDAIITNTEVRWFLPLNDGHENLHRFKLLPHEVEAVKRLHMVKGRFSECFLKSGEEGIVARLEPTPLEYWLCTTNAEDTLLEEKILKEHPDWEYEAILEHLARHFPLGAQGGGADGR